LALASPLEGLFTSAKAFGVTKASPLQRAICRVSDGTPLGALWDNPGVREGFGGVMPPDTAPEILCILAAIRSGKSVLAATKAFVCALTCDVTGLSDGDELRVPVLSVDKDSAHAVFNHLVGTLLAKPFLRKYMIGQPSADSVLIRHQTGREVEVKVTAMAKYGSTLVGRWLASCVLDEAGRMAGASESVRNLDDALHAIAGRIRPGGQILIIGSPNAPFGPVYDMVQESFGRPTPQLVVVRGTGPLLNPTWWNPARVAKTLRSNPRAHVTDVLGQFADSEDQLFSSVQVDRAMRKGPEVIPPRTGHNYVAAMDPAMRGNAWTLIVLGCDGTDAQGDATYYVALAQQWRGTKVQPLRPDTVLREIKSLLEPYGLADVWSDVHHLDSLKVIAEHEGLGISETYTTAETKSEGIENIRLHIETGRLELPPNRPLRADLLRVKRKVNRKHTVMDLPVTRDGRHCDYVPTLATCLLYAPAQPFMVEGMAADPGLEAARAAVAAASDFTSLARSVWEGGLHA
jgi:hypothetical protein